MRPVPYDSKNINLGYDAGQSQSIRFGYYTKTDYNKGKRKPPREVVERDGLHSLERSTLDSLYYDVDTSDERIRAIWFLGRFGSDEDAIAHWRMWLEGRA